MGMSCCPRFFSYVSFRSGLFLQDAVVDLPPNSPTLPDNRNGSSHREAVGEVTQNHVHITKLCINLKNYILT